MTGDNACWVALFRSVSYALLAEKILKKEGLPFKLIPVPRHVSSDCGVCLHFTADLKEKILLALTGNVEIMEVRRL